jgi:hypothetical protein
LAKLDSVYDELIDWYLNDRKRKDNKNSATTTKFNG